jgi:hypothetical protein
VEGEKRMDEGFSRRRPDPLAVKFGHVMSDPALRERCVSLPPTRRCASLKVGDSTTADIAEGFKVIVTRLEGGKLEVEDLA